MQLIEKYGYCVIPKGTILLRSGETTEFSDCMFFGLDDMVGGCFGRENRQVWEVLQDLKILFMVSHVTQRSWVISSIVEIYQSVYLEEKELDDLDIKQRDLTKREKLIEILKGQEIIGWLSSLENNPALEICLFPDKSKFSSMMRPLRSFSIKEYEFYSALGDLLIHPSKQFYDRSAIHINNFSDYNKSFESIWADEDPKQREFWKSCNLRMKLKV